MIPIEIINYFNRKKSLEAPGLGLGVGLGL
jgi:hypothetical protein